MTIPERPDDWEKTPMWIRPCFEGPIDVLGDVHGEIGPLKALLSHLGYDEGGNHPAGRRMVFVGDLGDRGPDSPAVIDLVRQLCISEKAQCLLGNHELNLLRGAKKSGNEWFTNPYGKNQLPGGEFSHCKPATSEQKPAWLEFFASLPLALERSDLRIVHAAWEPWAIEALRSEQRPVREIYDDYKARTSAKLEASGVATEAALQKKLWENHPRDKGRPFECFEALAERDELYQMENPIRIVTSGLERKAKEPFWFSGAWRMCNRLSWWDDYHDAIPVIFGHYWRKSDPDTSGDQSDPELEHFAAVGPSEWVGQHKNAFCVDFSIGGRYKETSTGVTPFTTHIAAMRWPERELWFETGRVN